MGLKFGVRVQFEANGDVTVDESNAWMSGAFGHIDIGARDPIYTRMHYAAAFGAGIGLNAGDTQKWIPGSYLETAGWTVSGDDLTLSYTTPRVNGVQVGTSYTPDTTNENAPTKEPENNDEAAWSAAINFVETVGDMSVAVSLGHISVGTTGSVDLDTDGDGTADASKSSDDRTYTNAGIKVGMGAFTFTASYATRDDGGYVAMADANGNESAANDPSDEHDTWAIGIGYADGPVSVSVGHMTREREDGVERVATMASAGYKLAPGVSWKTSIFGAEDDGGGEGTAFVTGLDIDF